MKTNTYSTSELLIILRKGQKAEMISPVTDIVVQKTEYNGLIVIEDANSDKNIGGYLPLGPTVMNALWNIIRKEVSFKEAMEHMNNGGDVSCEYEGVTSYYNTDNLYDVLYIGEMVKGTWYLEGSSND